MRKIERLKREAIKSCEGRMHVMNRFHRGEYNRSAAHSYCVNCDATVMVNARTGINDIDISGTAVAIECDHSKKKPIEYLLDTYPQVTFEIHVPEQRRGQGTDGYGVKIQSDYMAKINGKGRLFRIYTCLIGNNGASYIVKGGQDYWFRSGECPA